MRLRYTRPALVDLDSILDYVATHSPAGATRVHDRIETIVNLLLSHPRIGVRTDDPTIRRINALPYPYLIFYEISGDEIVIHAVRHSARNPSDMPGTSS
ncbi:MAG: type II toxin-antitoxin system RelE/ParE family toxin [Xanthobacteraceae bacterium]